MRKTLVKNKNAIQSLAKKQELWHAKYKRGRVSNLATN